MIDCNSASTRFFYWRCRIIWLRRYWRSFDLYSIGSLPLKRNQTRLCLLPRCLKIKSEGGGAQKYFETGVRFLFRPCCWSDRIMLLCFSRNLLPVWLELPQRPNYPPCSRLQIVWCCLMLAIWVRLPRITSRRNFPLKSSRTQSRPLLRFCNILELETWIVHYPQCPKSRALPSLAR